MSNLPLGAENDPQAPWNQSDLKRRDYICTSCLNNDMKEIQSESYECNTCGHIFTYEEMCDKIEDIEADNY